MKRFIFSPLLLIAPLLFLRGQSAKKVLFLGNSYTYFNNMPQLVANIATSMNDTFIFDKNTPDGYTLGQHYSNTTSKNKIKNGGWDYVIMQEQSQLPSFDEYNTQAGYYLSSTIREYNPCARILFFMTWGRKNGDAANCAAWPPVCTYEGMDSLLRLRYTEMAMFCESGLTPVGAVWRHVRQQYPAIELYQSDGSHPSLAGSYLAACCFYTSIFKKDPTSILYSGGVNSAHAANIRKAVKAVLFDSIAQWDFGKYLPTADFSYKIGSGANEVILANNSTVADSFVWDFGDGTYSKAKNPVYQYQANGTYTIKLTASNCDLSITHTSVKQKKVSFCSHTPTVFPDNLILCPNKKDTLWTQPYDTFQWLNGDDTIPGETKQYILPSGGNFYSVLATKNSCTELSQQVFVFQYTTIGTYYVTTEGNFISADTLCAGDTALLILSPNKPPSPDENDIKWFKNGLPLPASSTDTLVVTETGGYEVKLYDTVCKDYIRYQSGQTQITFINCDSSSTGVLLLNTDNNIRLYPNPVAAELNITVPPHIPGSAYFVSDILGRILISGTIEQTNSIIPVSGLGKGVYFLKVHNQTVKFIKD